MIFLEGTEWDRTNIWTRLNGTVNILDGSEWDRDFFGRDRVVPRVFKDGTGSFFTLSF